MEKKAPSVLGQTQGLHFLSLNGKQNQRDHWKTQEPTLLNTTQPGTGKAEAQGATQPK